MQATSEGSVRVDFFGGTLDIEPINFILPKVVTLNAAISLKAFVKIESIDSSELKIISKDYDEEISYSKEQLSFKNIYESDFFGPFTLVVQIIDYFNLSSGIKITLSSGAPPGSGLGGSSAMAMTLYKALCDFMNKPFQRDSAIQEVKAIEARILNSGQTGYQDYYPAVYGGILALCPHPKHLEVKQLYTEELKTFIEKHCFLAYSGQSRLSGINNWEVYKRFFDKDESIISGLNKLNEISKSAYKALLQKDFKKFLNLLLKEGEQRENLFPKILTKQIKEIKKDLQKQILGSAIKICGAGGGGCFLIIIPDESQASKVYEIVKSHNMELLSFSIEPPL